MPGNISAAQANLLEACVALHLSESISPEDARDKLFFTELAGLCAYIRCELPQKWQDTADQRMEAEKEAIYSSVLSVYSQMGLDEYCQDLLNALDTGTWSAAERLPDRIWKYLEDITGGGRDYWAELPGNVTEEKRRQVQCVNCGLVRELESFGEIVEVPSVIEGTFRVRCERCKTVNKYVTVRHRLGKDTRPLSTFNKVAGIVIVLLVLTGVLMIIFRLLGF